MGKESWREKGLLFLLILCALSLTARIVYLFAADVQRFPLNTVKITANYNHISRKTLEELLSKYLNESFFLVKIGELKKNLSELDWCDHVLIEKKWPDTLKITLVEKVPFAIWNQSIMTKEGKVFHVDEEISSLNLPKLQGPSEQRLHVLQIYEKLSKLLLKYDLQAQALQLRENQAWELVLTNGLVIRLGKRDLEQRLKRFCEVYESLFVDKQDKLSSVDLRYARGMAVQWKEQPRK